VKLELDRYLELAEQAARRAGQVLLDMKGRFTVRRKGWQDLVTSADLAAQEAARECLLDAFPDHTVLGEEAPSRFDPTAPFRWIIDPLDGTTNYVHGLDYYAVSIALEHKYNLLVGVIYAPELQQCFKAANGQGAFCNDTQIKVSDVADIADALVATGFPPQLDKRPDLIKLFERYSVKTHAVRRLGSTALNLAYTAMGRFDAFYSATIHSWDVAAGALLVWEAGGSVSNLDGGTYDLYRPDILATNGHIHQQMLNVAADVLEL